VRSFLPEPGLLEPRRVERCLRRLLVSVLVAGPVLAAGGVGGTLLGLAGFLVVFALAGALVIVRDLRPGVSLVSSAPRDTRASRG